MNIKHGLEKCNGQKRLVGWSKDTTGNFMFILRLCIVLCYAVLNLSYCIVQN